MSLSIKKPTPYIFLSGSSDTLTPDLSVNNIGNLGGGGPPNYPLSSVYDRNGNLYITGELRQVTYNLNGTPVSLSINNIGMYDGTRWYDMSGGLSGAGTCLAVNSQNHLIVGGFFGSTGPSISVNNIARWDGLRWYDLSGGVDGLVESLYFDSATNYLYLGGQFSNILTTPNIPSNKFARFNFNNNTWEGYTNIIGDLGNIYSINKFSNGDLVLGGNFNTIKNKPNLNNLARWKPTSNALDTSANWSSIGRGTNGAVRSVYVNNNDDLYAGGSFSTVDTTLNLPINKLALFKNNAWQSVGGSVITGSLVYTINYINSDLYIGGVFSQVGDISSPVNTNALAKWNGTTWSQILGGIGGPGSGVFSISSNPNNTSIVLGGLYDTFNGITTTNLSKLDIAKLSKQSSTFLIPKSNIKKI